MGDKRRDACKCGKRLKWDTDDRHVECAYCGTQYTVESTDVQVYWLQEIVEQNKPYRTDAR